MKTALDPTTYCVGAERINQSLLNLEAAEVSIETLYVLGLSEELFFESAPESPEENDIAEILNSHQQAKIFKKTKNK